MKGKHHSLETREKIRAALTGERNPAKRPDTRAKMSAARQVAWSRPEYREKVIAAKKEWASHPEAREKMRQAHLGKHPCSPETRAKISAANLGRPGTMLGKHLSLETREKIGAARKGKPLSPEHREKIGAASQAAWSRPEYREKIRVARSSPECREKVSGPNASNWRGGVSFEPYCPKFTRDFKERVRSFWGHQCGLCGKTQAENGRPLSVHHVSYLKRACCDDEVPRYFIPLCVSCHSKTGRARDHWQKILSRKIDKKFNGRCYFRQGEVLTSWGVKA